MAAFALTTEDLGIQLWAMPRRVFTAPLESGDIYSRQVVSLGEGGCGCVPQAQVRSFAWGRWSSMEIPSCRL
jgi:hypothetical protein